MNKKLILIDGSSMLSTSFFGSLGQTNYYRVNTEEEKQKELEKLMKTKDGRYTNAVYTMSKILLNIIKNQQPTHMAILWDVNRTSLERKKKFDGYKANRKDTIPQLGQQFGLMQEVIESMTGVKQYKLEGAEADDIIGTFAKSFEEQIPTYIITKDQDALQLITEKTKVWLMTSKAKDMYKERGIDYKSLNIPDGAFEYNPENFKEVYGIEPIQIIDLKALEGDSSDNIPGVKGVGPKAVLPLLNEYKTIEGIYEAIESNDEKELKEYFKNELGISRSPISNLTKRNPSFIAIDLENKLKQELNKKSKKEICEVFNEIDGKEFKDKVKLLSKMDDEAFKKEAELLLEEISTLPDEIVGKDAAFLSKDLATIKTDLKEFKDKELNELKVEFDIAKTKTKFQELEFKSLMKILNEMELYEQPKNDIFDENISEGFSEEDFFNFS